MGWAGIATTVSECRRVSYELLRTFGPSGFNLAWLGLTCEVVIGCSQSPTPSCHLLSQFVWLHTRPQKCSLHLFVRLPLAVCWHGNYCFANKIYWKWQGGCLVSCQVYLCTPTSSYQIFFWLLLLLPVARNASNCPEECLFAGVRAQARQCVSFSKGMEDWQGHDLPYLQVLCDSPEGPRPRRAPLAPLRSLTQSVFISLHPNILSSLSALCSPSTGDPKFLVGSLASCSYVKINK